jgi:hypothetical protein
MVEMDTIIEGDENKLLNELQKPSNNKLVQKASKEVNLRYDEFKDYEERMAVNQSVLLNDFGDLTGASYLRFRKEYEKKKEKLKLIELSTNEELNEILKTCQYSRNYVHHFSEPKLLSWRNYREDQLKNHPGVKWPPTNIELNICQITNVISILKLHAHHYYYYSMFNLLQYFIRNDYSLLTTGMGGNSQVIINRKESIEDHSAFIISENGGSLYLK